MSAISSQAAHTKAATALMALAHRTEQLGLKDSEADDTISLTDIDAEDVLEDIEADEALDASWIPMPFHPSCLMRLETLEEAVDIYAIALSVDAPSAAWGYPRALLLENMGSYDDAIQAFSGLIGTPYQRPADDGVLRCQQKAAGTYTEGRDGVSVFPHLDVPGSTPERTLDRALSVNQSLGVVDDRDPEDVDSFALSVDLNQDADDDDDLDDEAILAQLDVLAHQTQKK